MDITEQLADVDPQRIAIIKPSAFGDVIQSLPLLPVLKERFPGVEIDWVINRGLRALVEGHPLLSQVQHYDRRGGVRSSLRLLNTLRKRRYDLVIDLQGLLRTGVMTLATRAPLRIGLETAREGSHLACHGLLPNTGRDVPAHARYMEVARALGATGERRETFLPISNQDRAHAANALQAPYGPVLSVHVGARWMTKRWPVRRFAAVAASFQENHGGVIVAVGSPDEVELADEFCQELHSRLPGVHLRNLTGETSLMQLAAVLEQSDVVLCGDSGPMHMAAGLKTPVVAVFTCTSPLRSGPPPGQHRLVETTLPCAAGYHRTCPHSGADHQACFAEITVARTRSALEDLWEELSNSQCDQARAA